MVIIFYLLPIIGFICNIALGKGPGTKEALILLLIGEGIIGLFHWWMYYSRTRCKEYLGALVTSTMHIDAWTEFVEVTETKTDKDGNTHTVKRIKEVYHPEEYYYFTTRGSEFKTNPEFFYHIVSTWNIDPEIKSYYGNHIKGYQRHAQYYSTTVFSDDYFYNNPQLWIPVTETQKYVNKLRRSNSVMRFVKPDKKTAEEMGLIKYPDVDYKFNDAPCVLSRDFKIDDEADWWFRRFNARVAPYREMRLYILLFDSAKGISISEYQRAFWQGGNKNEFIICLGLNRNDKTVEWARAFSWADNQQLEVETAQWLIDHPNINWKEFYNWFSGKSAKWKRKNFSDFNYLNVRLALWQNIFLGAISGFIFLVFVAGG